MPDYELLRKEKGLVRLQHTVDTRDRDTVIAYIKKLNAARALNREPEKATAEVAELAAKMKIAELKAAATLLAAEAKRTAASHDATVNKVQTNEQ